MSFPLGLTRVWHSSKVWLAVIGLLSATCPDLLAIAGAKLGLVPVDPATWPHLLSTAKLAGTALWGAVILALGAEDTARKAGVTDSLPEEKRS